MQTTLLVLLLSLLLYFIPIWLLRGRNYGSTNERVVSKNAVPGALFQSSSVAYSMQLAMLGPFFMWGLTGDSLAPFLNSLAFMGGLLLIWGFRRQLTSFFSSKLSNQESITVHEFIADQFGGSSAVRRTASAVTLFGQLGIVIAEMLGLLAIMTALMPAFPDAGTWLLLIIFSLMVLFTVLGGNEGAMLTASLQLRIIYISIAVFIISMILGQSDSAETSKSFSKSSLVALAIIAIVTAASQWLSRPLVSRYVGSNQMSKSMLIDKAFAMLACIFLAFVAWFCFSTYFSMPSTSTINVPLITNTTPWIGLLTMIILPLCFQITDLSNWQKMASMRAEADSPETSRSLLGYAIEAPLIQVLCILLGMFVLIDPVFADVTSFDQFASRIFRSENIYYQVASSALVIAAFATALSTMDSAFSASICTFLSDMSRTHSPVSDERKAGKSAFVLTLVFFIATIFIAKAGLFFSFASEHFVSLLLAFYGAQLSFLPIIVIGLLAARRNQREQPLPQWVGIAPLIGGTFASLSCTFASLVLQEPSWSWYAVLSSLAVSSLIYFIGKGAFGGRV